MLLNIWQNKIWQMLKIRQFERSRIIELQKQCLSQREIASEIGRRKIGRIRNDNFKWSTKEKIRQR